MGSGVDVGAITARLSRLQTREEPPRIAGVIAVETEGEVDLVGVTTSDGGMHARDPVGERLSMQVGRKPVGSAAELNQALRGVKAGDVVMLLVRNPRGGTAFATVTAGADD